jgi:lipid-A-disaccharide synthase-like uncharacterized protein
MSYKIRFTWQLGVAIAAALFCLGYIINFISTNGYNRPAVFYAWCGLLLSMIFYQQHRKQNAKALAEREKSREENEFEEWVKDSAKSQ